MATDAALDCPAVVRTGARVVCSAYETVGFNRAQGALYTFDRPTGGWSAAPPVTQRAFASDGLSVDQLGRAGSFGWQSLGVTESGTFVEAPMSALNIALGYYPHDRIGYEFVTPDPIGKLIPAPAQARAGSSGNTLTFTYTASAPLSGGTLALTAPTGWSVPATTEFRSRVRDCVRGDALGCEPDDQRVEPDAGEGPDVHSRLRFHCVGRAWSDGATEWWRSDVAGVVRVAASEPVVSLIAQPVIRILAPDGSGTMTTPTSNMPHGATGRTLTFTYTAAPGGLAGGTVTLDVPNGWSTPSTTGPSAGFTKASAGTLAVASRTVTVSGLNLASGQKLVITYGAKTSGGPGAAAPATAVGVQPWQTQERSSPSGVLTNLAASPSITVT